MSAKILQSCFAKRLHLQLAKVIPRIGATCSCFQNPCAWSLTHNMRTVSRKFSLLHSIGITTVKRDECKIYLGQINFYCTNFEVEEIDHDKLKEKLKESRIVLIDVRQPEELEERGSYSPYYSSVINIPLGDVEDALSMSETTFKALYKADLPDQEDSEIVFSCAMGIRSMRAATLAKQMGFERVSSYKGGFEEWREKNQEDFE